MKKIFPLIGLLFICQEAPVLAVTQITDSLYVKQGAKITRLYTDSAALRTMTLSGSPIGTPGDSCMFLNLGVPVHCTKAQVLAWLGSSGITSINTGTAAAHTIVGEQGLQVLDSGTNLYKHVIIPATGYIIPTGSNMRVDSTTLADSAADAGKWGGNVYGGPYLGIHATADTAIAADRARKLATTRTIGKSTTFDGTANIVPDSAVSVVQATQLTTARTIGNTSFNGTANIIPDTCNKANRARYADSSGATHKADTSISSHQSAQLTTAVNIGNVSFNGTAAIIPDTANKANRARYSDSTGKIPDTVHIRLGLSANNINVSNVQTTNLNGTAIGSAYSVVGADQSGAAAARQAAYTNLTSIGSLTNTSGWLHNNGSGTFAYSTPSYSDVGADQSGAAAARQAAYANLTSIGSLANASGWLNNNGSGGFAYSTPPGTWASNFGTTVGTICQGNDSRLSDSRAPNGSASGDLTGSYPGPTVAHTNTSTLLYGDSLNVHGTIIQKNGNVGLGTTSPIQRLDVAGDIRLTGYIHNTTPYWFLDGNTNVQIGMIGGLSITSNYNIAPPENGLYVQGNVVIGTTSSDSQFTTSAGAHIGGGLLVGGAATIENNIVLGDYGGIPGFYMKSDNLSIGSQTGGLYGQITSNGWSIQSEITAPSMNVSGNDTVGGQIRAGGLYTTGYDTSYYGYTRLTTANQMVVDTFNIRHQEKLSDSIATMTTTFTFDCAHMRPLCTMTSATAGGTVSFINISDGLVFIFINATANSINLTLTHGTVGLGAYQGMTLICSQTSIFEEL